MLKIDAESGYQIAEAVVDARKDDLRNVNQFLWNNPEIGFQETKAHEFLSNFLESEGFEVRRHHILPTAFRAEYGGSGPVVAIMCEYDALPGIGHACGHNLIAESSIGAAIAVKAVMSAQKTQDMPKVVVLGTPAEENGTGKELLIQGGAFDDVDVALMAHPGKMDFVKLSSIALCRVRVIFKGKSSHAGQFPWDGVNALDAAVTAYVNTSVLRQQLKPTLRVQGIIKKGGSSSNIIPDETEMEYRLRGPTTEELISLKTRVDACFQAAAQATGCSVSIEQPSPIVKHSVLNDTISQLYEKHGERLGIRFQENPYVAQMLGASTDVGNVSHVLPTIQPLFSINTDAWNHTPAFREAAGTEDAHHAALKVAKVLSFIALDLFRSQELIEDVKKEYRTTFSKSEDQK